MQIELPFGFKGLMTGCSMLVCHLVSLSWPSVDLASGRILKACRGYDEAMHCFRQGRRRNLFLSY